MKEINRDMNQNKQGEIVDGKITVDYKRAVEKCSFNKQYSGLYDGKKSAMLYT